MASPQQESNETAAIRVGSYIYFTAQPWTNAGTDGGQRDVACVLALVGNNRYKVQCLVRPSQTFHKAGQVFFKQELLFSEKIIEIKSTSVVGVCYVLSKPEYQNYDLSPLTGKANDHHEPQLQEQDIFFCRSRYSTVTKVIDVWKKTHFQHPLGKMHAKKLTKRKTKREFSQTEIFVSSRRSIAGVTINFVADINVPQHFENIVKEPPRPLAEAKHESGNRKRRRVDRVQIQPFSSATADKSNDNDNDNDGDGDDVKAATVVEHRFISASYISSLTDKDVDAHVYQVEHPSNISKRARNTTPRRTLPKNSPSLKPTQKKQVKPSRTAKAKAKEKLKVVKSPVHQDVNDDECKVCEDGGEMICCDTCPSSFHPRCIGINLADIGDDDDWSCPHCSKSLAKAQESLPRRGSTNKKQVTKTKEASQKKEASKPKEATRTTLRRSTRHNPIALNDQTRDDDDEEDEEDEDEDEDNDDDDDDDDDDDNVEETTKEGNNSSNGEQHLQFHSSDEDDRELDDNDNDNDEDDDDDDDDDDDNDDDDDDDDDDDNTGESKKSQKSKASSSFENQETRDHFFYRNTRAQKTSNHTLAKLDAATMDHGEINLILDKNRASSTAIHTHIESRLSQDRFKPWRSYLANGFNLLVYGYGSKKNLLMDFACEYLSNHNVIVVNGYFPSLTVKQILKSLIENSLGYNGAFRTVTDQVNFIKSQFESETSVLPTHFIIIHNIDGATIRNEISQMALSHLASIPGIHLIASIDHLNAPLMWDHEKHARFKWVWEDCTNFRPYSIETSYDASLNSRAAEISIKGTTAVMQSLTRNGRKVFWVLIDYQMANSSEPDYKGLRFADYLALCQKQFAAHDDARLRSYMTEFLDHKLIVVRKVSGVEHVEIPAQETLLQSIIDMMVENFKADAPK